MTRPDDFEVIDLDAPHRPTPRPAPAPRPFGARVVLAVVVVSTLLLAGAGAWYGIASRPDQTTRTVTPNVYRGFDAGGCPTQQRCVPDPGQFTALQRAVTKWFPDADLKSDQGVTDPMFLHTFRETIVFRSSGVVLSATVQCVENGEPIQGAEHATGGFTTGPSVVTFVRPGGPDGCSAAVTADVPAGMVVPNGPMRTLADDADLYG